MPVYWMLASSTSWRSVCENKMMNFVLWMFVLPLCSAVEDLEAVLEKGHCMEEGRPLRLEYPNPLAKDEPDFMLLEWRYVMDNNGTEVKLLEYLPGKEPKINNPRASAYGALGLQLDDVTLDDARRYLATHISSKSGHSNIAFDVVMLVAPKLKTKKLSLSHTFDEKKCLADLTCGTMESLGDPPVSLVYTAPNGTTYTGVYKDGTLSLTVPLTEDLANIVCELDINSAASASCIEEPPRWKTAPSATLRADYERKCAKGKDPAKGTAAELRLHIQLNLCLILSAWISASWAK